MIPSIPSFVLLIVALTLGSFACHAPVPESSQEPSPTDSAAIGDRTELDSLRNLIHALVQDAPADDVSACRAIAFGAKPCGGPRAYLVYSIQATDSLELARVVEEFNELDARRNERLGLASDCMLVQRPDLRVEGGQCVAAPR